MSWLTQVQSHNLDQVSMTLEASSIKIMSQENNMTFKTLKQQHQMSSQNNQILSFKNIDITKVWSAYRKINQNSKIQIKSCKTEKINYQTSYKNL